MTWLSENPWPLAGTCFVAAVALLLMLKLTQQGKYMIQAGIAVAVGLLILGVEWLWVTDRERIARVVYDMADAVKQSDYSRIEAHLDTEFAVPGGMITRAYIRGALMNMDFDFVNIRNLETQAGQLTGRGKADFLAMAQWEERTSTGSPNFDMTPPPGVGFSVGFREAEPDIWTVTRIDVTEVPGGYSEGSVADYIRRYGR